MAVRDFFAWQYPKSFELAVEMFARERELVKAQFPDLTQKKQTTIARERAVSQLRRPDFTLDPT